MPALVSATVQIKNPEKFKEYASKVPETMGAHGGKMIARGKLSKPLAGEHAHQVQAIFEFPTQEAAQAWYDSDAYQALVALRNEAAHMNIAILESF
jgi:uncharacterized protein (DUF1330 family)